MDVVRTSEWNCQQLLLLLLCVCVEKEGKETLLQRTLPELCTRAASAKWKKRAKMWLVLLQRCVHRAPLSTVPHQEYSFGDATLKPQ